MRDSMRGADCTRPSRMIASWRPMFSPVTLPNLRAALGVQREADRRLVVLVERRPRVAQVAAGDRGHLAHQVVDGAAGVAGAPLAPGTISMPCGTWPFDSSASSRRRRPLLDDLQLEQARSTG